MSGMTTPLNAAIGLCAAPQGVMIVLGQDDKGNGWGDVLGQIAPDAWPALPSIVVKRIPFLINLWQGVDRGIGCHRLGCANF